MFSSGYAGHWYTVPAPCGQRRGALALRQTKGVRVGASSKSENHARGWMNKDRRSKDHPPAINGQAAAAVVPQAPQQLGVSTECQIRVFDFSRWAGSSVLHHRHRALKSDGIAEIGQDCSIGWMIEIHATRAYTLSSAPTGTGDTHCFRLSPGGHVHRAAVPAGFRAGPFRR